MKKLLAATALISLFAGVASAAPTNDKTKVFAKIFGGYAISKAEHDYKFSSQSTTTTRKVTSPNYGMVYGLGLGYNLTNNVFLEAEYYGHGQNRGSKRIGDYTYKAGASVDAGFANLGYSFAEGSKFRPYVFAGFGSAKVSPKVRSGSVNFKFKSKSVAAYQLGAGAAYNFTDNIGVDLGVRYVAFGSRDFKATSRPAGYTSANYKKGNELATTLGLKYSF